jgi:hypothetical protein
MNRRNFYEVSRAFTFLTAFAYGFVMYLRFRYAGYFPNGDYVLVLAILINFLLSCMFVYIVLGGIVAAGLTINNMQNQSIIAVISIIPTLLASAVHVATLLKIFEIIPGAQSKNINREAEQVSIIKLISPGAHEVERLGI